LVVLNKIQSQIRHWQQTASNRRSDISKGREMRELTHGHSDSSYGATDKMSGAPAENRYPRCTICAQPINASDASQEVNEWLHAACCEELDPRGLVAENARLKSALRRIGLPQLEVTKIGLCADGHHEAVLIARRTLELCR
jgi:hypothetical protein